MIISFGFTNFIKKTALIIFLSVFFIVSGCEYITGGTDNSEPPKALTNIKEQKKLVQLWSAEVGGGDYGQYLKLKPLVLDSEVVTVDGRGVVQARNLQTGKLLWENKLNKVVSAGVGGNNSKLFIGLADGGFLSLDAKNGKVLWLKALDKNILNTPFSDGANVYLQTTDGTLYSLRSEDGKLNWENKNIVPDLTIYSTSSPIVWQNFVIAGFSNGKIAAFDRQSGAPAWDYQLAMPNGNSSIQRMVDITSTPIAIDNVLYAANYNGNMVAIDLTNGAELWKVKLSTISDFSSNNRYLYVSDTEGTVWALNRFDGRVLWQQSDLHMRELSGTAFIGDTILVGDYEGYIHGLAEDHGGFVARTRLSSAGIRVAPCVKNGIIYILTNRGRLAAYKVS